MLKRVEVVSIKMPRTGSESFGEILEDLYPSSELWNFIRHMEFNPKIYDPDSQFYHDRDFWLKFRTELINFRPYNDFQYVHNHVPVGFFEGVWIRSPRVTFLREPVSWLLSCYWFAKTIGHIPKEMGVWDYVELDYRQNWMTMFVEDIKLFDFIGFRETWRNDVAMFIDRFTTYNRTKMEGKMIPTKNVQTDLSYISFRERMLDDKMFVRRCKKLHKEDYKLYEEAYNVFATSK